MNALVIGGASGIGEAIVNRLKTDLHSVRIIDKDPNSKYGVFKHQFPGKIHEWKSALLELVFITIGVPSGSQFDDGDGSKDVAILTYNLGSVISALRFVRPNIKQKASIVITSSVSASTADPGGAVYAAAKAGIEGLVRGLAREWAPVRVNAIAPGPTATKQFLKNVPYDNQRLEALRSPHGRLIFPEEVAEAAVSLSLMTGVSGVVLPVDLAGLSSSRRRDG